MHPDASRTAQRGAEYLAKGIEEMLGLGSTADRIADPKVERVSDVPNGTGGYEVLVSALVPIGGWDGYGKTPEDGAAWLLESVKECLGSSSSANPAGIRAERIAHVAPEPERGCTRCFLPPCYVQDTAGRSGVGVDEHGVCAECRDAEAAERRRRARVEALLKHWTPSEEPSAKATAFGSATFHDGTGLSGLIREFGPEGKRQVSGLYAGQEKTHSLGTHTLAQVLADFVEESRYCAHGTDRAYHHCPECQRQARYFLDGLWKRPVM